MNCIIRKAQIEDCVAILALVKQLALYEKAPNEVSATVAHYETTGFGANPIWWAYVAEVDGQIEGFALYYIRFSTWKGSRLYLEDFYVNEKLRGKGIGKLLFDQMIKECYERKFQGMVWQVLDWNEPALNFYRKYHADLDPEWINGSLSAEQIEVLYEGFNSF